MLILSQYVDVLIGPDPDNVVKTNSTLPEKDGNKTSTSDL